MKIKSKFLMSITTIIMALLMMVPSGFTANAAESVKASDDEVVLFEGNEFHTGEWGDTWGDVVTLKDLNKEDFKNPFTLEIEYEGGAPMVIMMGTESNWAQVSSSYSSNGTAYYTYDACCETYGSKDFSGLRQISIRPNGSDVTVKKVTLNKKVSATEISLDFKGTSGKIINDMTTGWNLGNTLDSVGDWITQYGNGSPESFETAWGNPVTTKAMIDKVKAAGFNSIRIPVTWKQHIGDAASGYKIDDAWMKRVKEVVDYAVDDDMYVILNMHHDVDDAGWFWASDNSLKTNKDKFEASWNQIAENFKDYDNKLLFEGFNEMLDEKTNWQYPGKAATDAVNKYNQIFVDTVRKTGGNNPTRCLIVNTYAASPSGDVLDDFVMPKDTVENSLMAQIHFYSPYAYANKTGEWTKQTAWKDNGGKASIDGTLMSLYHKFTSNGIPVIMGEIAACDKENTADRAEYASYVVNQCKKYGIRCFWWDAGGSFEADKELGYYGGMSLMDRTTLKWVYPEVVKGFTGVDPNEVPADKPEDKPTDKPEDKPVEILLGDINGDNVVTISDYTLFRRYINSDGEIKIKEENADINKDGKIDFLDLLALKNLI